ncbi:MAG: VCBS repeat-containing protein [bacterium]|nr:VCBS repeat-containing protein [bacterium]
MSRRQTGHAGYDGSEVAPEQINPPPIGLGAKEGLVESYRPGVLRAIRGAGVDDAENGGPIFDLADPALRTESPTHVAVGDLDGDGRPEIVAMLQWAGNVVLAHTGEVKWALSGVDSGSYGGPAIANVDGLPETSTPVVAGLSAPLQVTATLPKASHDHACSMRSLSAVPTRIARVMYPGWSGSS